MRISTILATSFSCALALLVPQGVHAINLTLNNNPGDLDGDGDAGAGEQAVVQAAASCWAARIATNRNYTLTAQGGALMGNTLGQASHSSLDGSNRPDAGTLTLDNDGTSTWFVDGSINDSLEFAPDPVNRWRFVNGPAGTDLYSVTMHEVGHALGWICGTSSCNRAPDNTLYDGLMVPTPANFMAGNVVSLISNLLPNPLNVVTAGDGVAMGMMAAQLIVNELSHTGVNGDLMFPAVGGGVRQMPSFVDVNMFFHAYNDALNFPPNVDAGADIVAECSETGGSDLSLNGGASADPDGDTLIFSWTCNNVSLSDTDTVTPDGFFSNGQTEQCRLDLNDLAACLPDADRVDVTVVDTTDPVVTAPADVVAECTSAAGTPVDLGLASATDICDPFVPVSSDAPGVFPLGMTTVTWEGRDDDLNLGSATQVVSVQDTTPPSVDAIAAEPDQAWPGNHKLVPVQVGVDVSDVCDLSPICTITGVSSDEAVNDRGDGNTAPDFEITGSLSVNLRAERSGRGGGRTYTLAVECADASGNTTPASVEVAIQHDQRSS